MSGRCRVLLAVLVVLLVPLAARSEDRPTGEGVPAGLNGRRVPALAPPRGPRRLALCIGIDGYQCEGYPALQSAVADAKDLGKCLQVAGYDVTLMTDDAADGLKPTYGDLDRRLTEITRQADHPGDTLLISFAGHGDQVADEVGLLPLDFGQAHRLLPLRQVLGRLSSPRCIARKKLLVLDVCHSSTDKPQRRLNGGFFRSIGTPDDVLVVTGCGENQFSIEDVAVGHSRLTQALLDGLAARKAFVQDHEFLFADEWISYVQATFRERGWAVQESPQRFGRVAAKVRFDVARRELPKQPPYNFADKRFVLLSMQKAQDAYSRQDYLATIKETTKALRTTEPRTDSPAVRAMAYLELGYQDKALADTDAVLAAEPENAVALQVKGIVEYNGGAFAAARSHLARASALVEAAPGRWPFLASGGPAADRWVRLGYIATRSADAANLAAAIGYFSRVLEAKETTSEQVLHALIGRIACHDREGKPELAADDYDALSRTKEAAPEQMAKLVIHRGVAYGKSNRLEAEAADYARVLGMKELPPDVIAETLFDRAICYGEQGKTDLAVADYTAVIGAKDTDAARIAAALVNRGLWYNESGQLERAAADYTAAVRLQDAPIDQTAKAIVNRGVCYHRMNKTDLELADYSSVIQMLNAPATEMASALVNRGIVHTQLGKVEEAIADYTTVILMKNAPPEELAAALANRGWRYYVSGELNQAATDSRRAAEINPTDPRPAYNLALILVRQQKFAAAGQAYRLAFGKASPQDEAVADLIELRDKLNGPPETTIFIGWLKMQSGDGAKGRAELTAYLNKYPRGPLAGFARELLTAPLTKQTVVPR